MASETPLSYLDAKAHKEKTYIAIDCLSGSGGFGEQEQVVEEVRLQLSPALVLLDLSLPDDASRAEQPSRCRQVEALRQTRGSAHEEFEFRRTRAGLTPTTPGNSTLSESHASFSLVSLTRIASLMSFNVCSAVCKARSSAAWSG